MQPRVRKQPQKKSLTPRRVITPPELEEIELLKKIHDQLLQQTIEAGTYIVLPTIYRKFLEFAGPSIFGNLFVQQQKDLFESYKKIYRKYLEEQLLLGNQRLNQKDFNALITEWSAKASSIYISQVSSTVYSFSKYLLFQPMASKIACQYFTPLQVKVEDITDPTTVDTLIPTIRKRNMVYKHVNAGITYVARLYTAYLLYQLMMGLIHYYKKDSTALNAINLVLEILTLVPLIKLFNSPVQEDALTVKLSNLRINLNKALRDCQQNRWQQQTGKNLDETTFTLKLETFNFIPVKDVKKIIDSAFLKHGIKIKLEKSIISVKGNILLTDDVAASIQKTIYYSLTALEKIRRLRDQITELTKIHSLNYLSIEHLKTDGTLPSCEFLVYLDDHARPDEIKQLLLSTLGGEDKNLTVSIKRTEPLDDDAFKKLIKDLKSLTVQRRTSELIFQASLFSTSPSKGKQREKKSTETDNLDLLKTTPDTTQEKTTTPRSTTTTTSSTTPANAETKTWKDGTYSETSEKNTVYMIEGEGTVKGKMFATSLLTQHHFVSDLAYKKFTDQVRYPKFARFENDQGLKRSHGMRKTPEGEQFEYHAKFKVLGDQGDTRVYCELQQNENGEILYVAKGVKEKAHKRR